MLNFLDEAAVKSVRKFLAYGAGTIFFGSCIWVMASNNGDLSPTQYSIVAGVFSFYFLKQLFNKDKK